jgi:hypothetical protein
MIIYLILIINIHYKLPLMTSDISFLAFNHTIAALGYIPLFKLVSRYTLQTLHLHHNTSHVGTIYYLLENESLYVYLYLPSCQTQTVLLRQVDAILPEQTNHHAPGTCQWHLNPVKITYTCYIIYAQDYQYCKKHDSNKMFWMMEGRNWSSFLNFALFWFPDYQTMEKTQKSSNPESHTPSSKTFKIWNYHQKSNIFHMVW